jgi:hypothetical protein
MRSCCHCSKPIPRDVMIRARWKALFCSEACRTADKVAIRAARLQYRKERGACLTCGRGGKRSTEVNSPRAIEAVVSHSPCIGD